MDAITVSIIVAVPVVLLLLIFWRFRWQMAQLRQAIGLSGEAIVIEPQRGFYQGSVGGIVSLKTEGVITLTDRRIIFRKPIGKNIEVPLSRITQVSKNKWFKGNYRGGREFLILALEDGSEVAFMVKDLGHWMQEVLTGQGRERTT